MNSREPKVTERLKLWNIISERNLSWDIRDEIILHIGKFHGAEKETAAEQIQELLNNSKTEAEILEKLNQL